MIYVLSPYTHPIPSIRHQRYLDVCNAVAWLARKNEVVYSPIVHWHPISVAHKLPPGISYWRKNDFFFLRICSYAYILTIDGWTESKGIAEEIKELTSRRDRINDIFLMNPDGSTYTIEPYAR